MALIHVALTLMCCSALLVLAVEAVGCFRRWRLSLAVDQLMESVADVPYYYYITNNNQRLPAGGDRCVICLAEYENGEGRFVLPRCAHAFHRACIAPWLRRGSNTCPICRATAAAVNDAHPAADNMV
jgi:hypothetical protein